MGVWMPARRLELYHHGVKGMKWGVRRSQPYANGTYGRNGAAIAKAEQISYKGTARAYGRSMNKLARIAGESNSKKAEYTEKHNKIVDKYEKAKAAGNTKRVSKLESKAWKTRAKIEMEKANAKVASEKWAKLGVDAAEKGYNVKLRAVTYDSRKVRNNKVMAHALLGIYGSIPVSLYSTARDVTFRKANNSDYSPYSYTTLKAKVTKPKS